MPETILVVEYEPALRDTISYNLMKEGFTVESVSDGNAAIRVGRRLHPDLILLDLMIPELDGMEVCRILRREMRTPIIILAARGEEVDRILGLEMGADDYMTRPFSMPELLARIRAQIRRTRLLREELGKSVKHLELSGILVFGNLVIDQSRQKVTLADQPLSLQPLEYRLLICFAEHKGEMLSRQFILERVWGWGFVGDSRTVDVHVGWLRQKIEADNQRPKRIVTIRAGGYRFEG